ncbi:Tim10/DDP family zinc finger-domain-containing protein [Chaetomium sp. MPI-SDFR-AT-0129]|uniref:Mitochondrial import inner membrane translocase subunit n=1 Tax=Dichotomopilus funicola TaxID=1934379 RepID=A0AAN6V8W9_9PEZI|nr:Tim10/DDP family zinc finger-domain-containing protein [Chaetomium sp. MPI-SDFR-AT-0129]KAK4147003.1 Tim10/DDP family zinc finger-domain-containing protein [Dichotomopilus funicola]
MSSSGFSVDEADLEKLSPADKAELRQFFANETQRSRIRAQTHELTGVCWTKCVPAGTVKSGALASGEQTCLANCVDRFMDANLATLKHLSSMRK